MRMKSAAASDGADGRPRALRRPYTLQARLRYSYTCARPTVQPAYLSKTKSYVYLYTYYTIYVRL